MDELRILTRIICLMYLLVQELVISYVLLLVSLFCMHVLKALSF